MAAKFIILGEVVDLALEIALINVNVRRNFRSYEGDYLFDNIDILIAQGISNMLLQNLKQHDIVQIIGRIENNHIQKVSLIAEQITILAELRS